VRRVPALAWFALAFFVLLEAMLAAAILFWPEFSANLSSLRSMTSAIPILGEQMQKVEEHGFPAYVLAQHFFKGCNALGVAAAVLFAAPAIAGEAHRGTLELLLARPFSRRRILAERWLGGALALVLPVVLSTLTIPALGARVDEYEAYGPYLLCAAHQSLFLLAVYAVTFLCSSLGTNPSRITMTVLFVAVFQFALYMVKTVTHYSLFRLCDMDVLLALHQDGEWRWPVVGALAATVLASLTAACVAFERRTP
jgi:ABC-type transport system involved in multi-copper enzyme maturation permease subunit